MHAQDAIERSMQKRSFSALVKPVSRQFLPDRSIRVRSAAMQSYKGKSNASFRERIATKVVLKATVADCHDAGPQVQSLVFLDTLNTRLLRPDEAYENVFTCLEGN